MTGRCRAAVVAAVAGALLAGLAATPASADNHDLVVVFSGPGNGEVLADSSFAVTGRVDPRPGLLDTRVEWISVTLVREGGGSFQPTRNEAEPPEFAARFEVARNGRYTARVEARGQGRLPVLGVGLTSVDGSGSRPFGLAAPPRVPQDVKVDVSPERVTTVSWARNTEPDLLFYAVFRKDPGAGSFKSVAQRVDQRESGRISFVDRGTTGGGAFAYQVVAVRAGADAGSEVTSTSPARSISVPTPTTSTDPGAAAPGGPGGTGDQAAPGGQARVDLSAFLAGRSGSALPAPPRELEIPDTGFSGELPFGARPPGDELEEGELEAEPRSLDVGTTTSEFVSRGRPLVPVAGGAILLLLAMHLRLLNKRIKAAPAVVSGPARTDLPAGDLAPANDPELADEAEPAPPLPPPAPVLFDYEDIPPAPPAVQPVDDEVWSEEAWDEEEVWEVVSPAR